MKKSLLVCLVCAALVCAFALPNLQATDAPAGAISMTAMGGNAVTFNHSSHASLKCEECHHQGDAYKCTDAGCHDIMDKKDKSAASWYNAVHSKKAALSTCVSCHSDAAGDDKDKKKELAGCKGSVCHP